MVISLLLLLAVLCYFVPGVLQAVQCVVYAGLAIWLVAQGNPRAFRVTTDEPGNLLVLVLAVAILIYYLARRKPAASKPS